MPAPPTIASKPATWSVPISTPRRGLLVEVDVDAGKRCGIVERVPAFAALVGIGDGVECRLDDIVARPGVDGIAAAAVGHGVVARPGGDRLVGVAARHGVVAGAGGHRLEAGDGIGADFGAARLAFDEVDADRRSDGRVVDQVVALAAVIAVGGLVGIADHRVVAGLGQHHVLVRAARQDVGVRAALQAVVALFAEQLVLARPAGDDVVAGAAEEKVVARLAVDRVVARVAEHHVAALAAEQAVVALAAGHPVVAVAAEDDVVAVVGAHQITAIAGHDVVVAVAADDRVVAAAGVDVVVAAAAVDVVGAFGADQHVGAGRAEDRQAFHDVEIGLLDHRQRAVGDFVGERHRTEQGGGEGPSPGRLRDRAGRHAEVLDRQRVAVGVGGVAKQLGKPDHHRRTAEDVVQRHRTGDARRPVGDLVIVIVVVLVGIGGVVVLLLDHRHRCPRPVRR